MGYTLTRRPYLLLGFFHMLIGLLLLSTGIVWLLMTFFYWPNESQILQTLYPNVTSFYNTNEWTLLSTEYQAACWIVYTAQIWAGFLVSSKFNVHHPEGKEVNTNFQEQMFLAVILYEPNNLSCFVCSLEYHW